MKTLFIISLCIYIFSGKCFGQKDTSGRFENKNSVNFEVAGHGVLYSINYERIILNKSRFKTAAQIGTSYYPHALILHVLINEIISFNKHHVEFGACISPGANFERRKTKYFNENFSLRGGYRFQKPDGNIIFKLAFIPLFAIKETGASNQNQLTFWPYAGASFGYAF